MGKVAVSEEIKKLEEETLFMENELLKLREVVKKQRIKEQSQQKRRKSKGKTPRYRKLRAKDKAREPFVPSKVLRPELAHKWTPKNVSTWLDNANLSQYKTKFRENDIDGSVLLELGVDDLDYMEIGSLAHRKAILKAVQKLRNARDGRKEAPLCKREEEAKVQSIPEESNPASNGSCLEASQGFVSEAVLDEAAEHKSFVEAVEEWRQLQRKSEPATVDTVSAGVAGDETEHTKFKAAVDSWRESSQSAQGKAEIVSYEEYVEKRGKDMQKLKAKIISDFEKHLSLGAPPSALLTKYTRSDISACY